MKTSETKIKNIINSLDEINRLVATVKLSVHRQLVSREGSKKNTRKLMEMDSIPHIERLASSMADLNFEFYTWLWDVMLRDLGRFLVYEFEPDLEIHYSKTSPTPANSMGKTEIFKLRIILSRNGQYDFQLEPYTKFLNVQEPFKLRVLSRDEFFISSSNPVHKYKYFPRMDFSHYLTDSGADEVIWFNEKGFLCEGSFTNIFFLDENDTWKTPHLSCNILPGIMRAKIIAELNAEEGFYIYDDLMSSKKILLTNSLIDYKEAVVTSGSNLLKT